jgi:hypothetical protein
MKSPIFKWITIRLFLVLALAARYFVAYTVSKHWSVPIEDALIGVLLFSVSWLDTQLYFDRRSRDGLQTHSKPAAPKESPTHAQLQQASLVLRSNPRPQ